MKINDYIKVDDKTGPRGYVIFKKADGTVIFEKENLIVNEGRKYVRELFIKNAFTTSKFVYNNQYDDYELTKIAFGSAGSATSLDTDALGDIIDTTIDLTKELIEASTGQMYIVFKGSMTPDSGQVVRELGLYLTDASEGGVKSDILFSRVVFDAAPVEADETYNLDYYLYF